MDEEFREAGDFSWRDVGDGFLWEFSDRSGAHLAEVAFIDDGAQRWSWYVALPEEWHYEGSANPAGLARSAEAGKAICEGILRGTILRDG